MKSGSKALMAIWIIRALWLILPGLWGAWLGAGGYFHIKFNADSFAALFAGGYFAFFALIGLTVGIISGALVGVATEWLLRRLGVGILPSVLAASLVCFLACLALSDGVQARYPGIQIPPIRKIHPNRTEVEPPPMTSNPCLGKPPADPIQRRAWESECR